MTDGTPKLVMLRTGKAINSQEIIEPPVSTPERDGFIAETAVKFDQLQASHRILAREVSELAAKVAEIHETAGQDHRLHAFQQSQQRLKERQARRGRSHLPRSQGSTRPHRGSRDRRLPRLQQLRGGES